jgi:hypothetical protein
LSTQVGPYRDVLKASSARGMLERKARLADVAQAVSGHEPETRPAPDAPADLRDLECDADDHPWRRDHGWLGKQERWAYLRRWADDGGSVRCV